ncbi:MAG: hypothetical protein ACD_3C00048G0001 [uncultured bacterium (gcode 4)]|uniref:DUF4153 domain-containing protein n=1 Tax=uncultured bacterium (gcode 4) TaxID=1234023 RepID=K2FBN0_9BACT|nr:MAG: hypothetical protein ACD_3C00048G0001 [uncultured bacterium (gcode 4)]
MKNLFSSLNLENLRSNLTGVFKRFPLPMMLIFAISALLITDLHWDFEQNISNNILKTVFSIVITFFLSLWFYLSSENLKLSNIKKNWLQLLAIFFWIMFFLWLKKDIDNSDSVIFIALTLLWITSYVFFAPYVKKLLSKEDIQGVYYSYFFKIGVVYLISTILWGVLFALWSIWIASVFELFDLSWKISEDIYGDWAIIALSFITPIFALTQIPKKETFNKDQFVENAFFSFLVKFIAIPFICIYFIILYAYSIKVLTNFWDWPKWEVSWLVIWFSIFGYLIYMFSYAFEEKYKFIWFFRKWFPYVVIPQLFMLFYAIYLRIMQYDITMNRYFIVVFGIWLLVISAYLIFSRKKYLAYIPLILTIFTILISIWPWWVYSLPESRQLSRLEKNLVSAWILKNWEIIPLKNETDINQDLSKEIYSWINYLCRYDDCDSIKKLFPKQYEKVVQKHKEDYEYSVKGNLSGRTSEPSAWNIVNWITEEIKVKSYFNEIPNSNMKSIYLNTKEDIFPIDTAWYSKILKIYSTNFSTWAIFYFNSNSIDITENWNVIDTVNAKEIIDKLSAIYSQKKEVKMKKEDMVFELKGNIKSYKVILEHIKIDNPLYEWGEKGRDNYYVWWYVLVK